MPVLAGALAGIAHGQAPPDPPDLDTVVERASTYVVAYEEQLGTLVGEEAYYQEMLVTRPAFGPDRQTTYRRRIDSDFMLIRVEDAWLGVRNVRRVDGFPVESPEDFASDVTTSRDALIRALQESIRYNIGEFVRTVNMPAFALELLHPGNIHRFQFEENGESRIEDVGVWEIGFTEVVRPTFVQGITGNDRQATGRFWIDPDNGSVLRTEVRFEVDEEGLPYTGTIEVSYAMSPELGMWLPRTLEEHFRRGRQSVDTRAVYSNFKRFEVDVRLDLGPAEP